MILAVLNQKAGVGKATLALHLAGRWAGRGRRVLVVDADPQGSALDWSEQRAREGLSRLFGVVGLARDLLHHERPETAADYDRVVIDGPPRVAAVVRSTLIAADLVLLPATPSPIDGWASAEMLRLLAEPGCSAPPYPHDRCSSAAPRARSSRARPPKPWWATTRPRSARRSDSGWCSRTRRAADGWPRRSRPAVWRRAGVAAEMDGLAP